MKTYELTYIVSPEMSSEEAEAKGKEIESAITSREGAILKQSNPVAKTFSHPVGKKASGFLGVLEFNLDPEKVVELQEILKKDDKVVRHMLIIKEAAEFKKERRTRGLLRTKPVTTIGQKTVDPQSSPRSEQKEEPASVLDGFADVKEKPASKIKEIKEKVELKDIEQELDEILG